MITRKRGWKEAKKLERRIERWTRPVLNGFQNWGTELLPSSEDSKRRKRKIQINLVDWLIDLKRNVLLDSLMLLHLLKKKAVHMYILTFSSLFVCFIFIALTYFFLPLESHKRMSIWQDTPRHWLILLGSEPDFNFNFCFNCNNCCLVCFRFVFNSSIFCLTVAFGFKNC